MTDIFQDSKAAGDVTPAAAAPEGTSDQTAFDFIGEGKRYATPEVALAAIPHKDAHIAQIEAENAQLRAKVESAKTVEQLLEQMKGSAPSTTATPEAPAANQQPDVSEVVRSVLQEEQMRTIAEQNVAMANQKLAEMYGEQAQAKAAARAQELGMDMATMKALAERSPQAFLTLFPTGEPQSSEGATTPPRDSDVNTSTTSGGVPEEGTQAYFDEIRRRDKKAFFSPEVQKARMRAAMENPEKFFGSST